ncbi:class I lanthipeptide [Chitinophaga flava]|nr:class I lanthipeptide [Chitinophaga flava]
MKKKKISLEKKLSLHKETIASLSEQQKNGLKGGIKTEFYSNITWDPWVTCETHAKPDQVCM